MEVKGGGAEAGGTLALTVTPSRKGNDQRSAGGHAPSLGRTLKDLVMRKLGGKRTYHHLVNLVVLEHKIEYKN